MFGATDFTAPEGLEFRFRLEGIELEWSDWQPVTGKEYTNLPPGTYVFHLQARNAEGQTSRVARLRLRIAPPWYGTPGAIMVYLLLLGLLLGSLILIPRRQFEKEKAAIFTRHQSQEEAQMQELARSRQQIDHLLQEKLESEINHKTRELATATMHLVQKNEVLTHLREALEQVAARNPGYPGSQQLQEIIRMLNHDNQFDADWEQFAAHFDEVHAGFLRRLQERYPQLTPKDQRLCAYLRMNLATKEIAPLMNISVRGVEISRYRLRKKLELDSEVNLNEFMMGF
jgi:DNA-binding CsgD family transcriptional regulator